MGKHQRQLDQLDAEIAELENASGVVPQGEQQQQQPPQQQQVEPLMAELITSVEEYESLENGEAPPPPPPPQPDSVMAAAEQQKPQLDLEAEYQSLNNRYVKLRQASDSYKFETRQQLAALQEALLAAQEENETLKQALAEYEEAAGRLDIVSQFDQADVDVLGEGTIASFQKAINQAVEAATKPLKAELLNVKKAERDRLRMQAQSNRSQAYSSFEEQLGRLVPNFRAINVDKNFIEWLRQPSQYTGTPRIDSFRKAEQVGDVERVAQFFVEYEQITAGAQDLLAGSVTPSGRGGGGTPPRQQRQSNEPKVFTMAFINKFYDDDINGKYKGRESLRDKLDAEIDLALKEGRVV